VGLISVLLDHADIKLTIDKDGEVDFIKEDHKMINEVNKAIKTGPKGVFQLSNHEKMAVNAVTNLSNLLTMWNKQDLMGRKLLVKTLYPKGIVVDREKTLYRTQNQNVFIEYIQDLTGDNGQTKKRNSELKFNYSALVDNSIEISNLSFTPRELIDTHHIMTLIVKSST
jgi:hypothetical protein